MDNYKAQSGVIKPIDTNVVHQICSGQVVLSLAIAVKELIENSIDAGATIIDITLKEFGSDIIEVSDNGSGVLESNFQALTLKHYTSKIEDFSDLQSLETLGFRGEALSSLSALADLSILTKHSSEEQAKKIKYDKNGRITSISLAARQSGTTVTLENLFYTLPVRRKEFLKNLKREFNKMCQLLYAYCLVSKGVKFTCTNTTSKGNKNIVVATQGLNKVRENIISVFGPKQLSSLIDIDVTRPDEEILNEFNIKFSEEEELPFEMEFIISSVTHGSGRSSTDRQFFYVNSRPVEPTNIIKLINHTYKQFNSNQYPFVFLNISLKNTVVDVNVTPDKRQVFLEKEKLFLAAIKASLLKSFELFPSQVPTQNQDISQFISMSNSNARKGIKRSLTESPISQKNLLDSFRKKCKSDTVIKIEEKTNQFLIEGDCKIEEKIMCRTSSEKILLKSALHEKLESLNETLDDKVDCILDDNGYMKRPSYNIEAYRHPERKDPPIIDQLVDVDNISQDICRPTNVATDFEQVKLITPDSLGSKIDEENKSDSLAKFSSEDKVGEKIKTLEAMNSANKSVFGMRDKNQSIDSNSIDYKNIKVILDEPSKQTQDRKIIHLDISLETIRKSLQKNSLGEKSNNTKVKFHSSIAPENNIKAEEELQKQLSKENFQEMSVIGQFNLGFIITKLESDLFIIDQHATDEKYNFEQLQATTTLQKQILVNPKPLELTAGNEAILIENEEIFKKNGFHFSIDKDAPSTKKVLLTAIPVSQNFIFGKDDIDEMLFMLKDSSNTMCRPSRVRAMFASRACRKSVMIGKFLSVKDMKQLIDHMSQIDQPWNCPHGRPTIRHLINLDLLIRDNDE